MTEGGDRAERGSWIDRRAPPAARPWLKLARADRPVGFWLLMWPCWWSAALASPSWPDPGLLALFAAGAVVMRAAGCVVNDIWDRKFDSRVARTRDRPLASGAISLAGALVFLALLLAAGATVLLQLPPLAVALGVASLLPVAVYPAMKRFTWWPQLFLGFTFNWGALIGWAAATGELSPAALLLYGGCVAWTCGYDTIYAHQDKADDARIGLRSAALALGGRSRAAVSLLYGVFLAALVAAGAWAGIAWPFYAALAPVAAHLAWQAGRVDFDRPASCHRHFTANGQLGPLLFAAIVLGRLAG